VTLAVLSLQYLSWMTTQGCSPLTVKNRRSHLRRFLSHLEGLDVTEPHALRREHIEDFVDHLTWEPTRFGPVMKVTTRNVRLRSVRRFVHWLYDHDHASHDPAAGVSYAREPQMLPRDVLTEQEMLRLLDAPDGQRLLGFRDKMILEVLYATGMRVRELVQLDIGDVDTDARCAFIRGGKGHKDRVVPTGERAASTLVSYCEAIHPELAREGVKALVVNYRGTRISPEGVEMLVRRHAKRARLAGRVTPHRLRHACATHMTRNGASLRHVQELLGHVDISTTEIYTRLTCQELIEAHARFHPREKDSPP
jgi:integrase/recombinase XerD